MRAESRLEVAELEFFFFACANMDSLERREGAPTCAPSLSHVESNFSTNFSPVFREEGGPPYHRRWALSLEGGSCLSLIQLQFSDRALVLLTDDGTVAWVVRPRPWESRQLVSLCETSVCIVRASL